MREARIIEGSNHFYKGKMDETSDVILKWLSDLIPVPVEVADCTRSPPASSRGLRVQSGCLVA